MLCLLAVVLLTQAVPCSVQHLFLQLWGIVRMLVIIDSYNSDNFAAVVGYALCLVILLTLARNSFV